MKRKVIAYFVFKTVKSAGTRSAFEHVDRLREKGFETRIISVFGRQPDWFPLKTPVYSIFSAFLMKDIDILVSTFWPISYVMLFIRAKQKYCYLQGWEVDFYRNKFLKYLVTRSIMLPYKKIVISKYLQKKIKNISPQAKVYRVDYLEIDKSIYKPSIYRKSMRQPHILSIISWYNTAKGPDLLVKTILELKKIHPEYVFTLISLEKYRYKPVFDTFISNPQPTTIANILRKSDIFLVTSRSEGYYIPGLEAMACGCPMITTNCGGINEYAIHNENAVIVKSVEEIWEKDICQSVITKKRFRNKLIANGYRTVKRFNWHSIIKSLEKIYTS